MKYGCNLGRRVDREEGGVWFYPWVLEKIMVQNSWPHHTHELPKSWII